MAQVFPNSPQVVYDTLAGDTAFTDLLGEYTFANGQTGQALSVQSPGGDLPGLKKIEGLECIIHDTADLRTNSYYGSVNVESTWRVFMICWEPATGYDMTAAVTRMLKIFGAASSMETLAVADGLGALVQTMIMIPSDKPILI